MLKLRVFFCYQTDDTTARSTRQQQADNGRVPGEQHISSQDFYPKASLSLLTTFYFPFKLNSSLIKKQ